MAIISSYPVDNSPNSGDYLVGTKVTTAGTQINPTKNYLQCSKQLKNKNCIQQILLHHSLKMMIKYSS